MRGHGCSSCSGILPFNTSSFISRSRKVHGSKYDYSRVVYVNNYTHVDIRCKTCDVWFKQVPYMHWWGNNGCTACASESRKLTFDEFKLKSKSVHGDKYSYLESSWVGRQFKVSIVCKCCKKTFNQTASDHMSGKGCSNCNSPNAYSKIAIRWLNAESKKRRIKIQHAENVGEFKIPGTLIAVDGYNARTKTVFEFHGDCWHGNPKIYSPRSKPHPFNGKTALRLFNETKAREARIKALGYNVVSIWESDFRSRTGDF